MAKSLGAAVCRGGRGRQHTKAADTQERQPRRRDRCGAPFAGDDEIDPPAAALAADEPLVQSGTLISAP